MRIPKFLDSILTVNFNFNDNRKIELASGDKNRNIFLLSEKQRSKVIGQIDKILDNKSTKI